MTLPEPTRRTLRAVPLMTVWPSVTWPSPAITTLPSLRTVRMVVPCQMSGEDCGLPMSQCDIGAERALVKHLLRGGIIALTKLNAGLGSANLPQRDLPRRDNVQTPVFGRSIVGDASCGELLRSSLAHSPSPSCLPKPRSPRARFLVAITMACRRITIALR